LIPQFGLVGGFGSLQFRPAISTEMVRLASMLPTCTVGRKFMAFSLSILLVAGGVSLACLIFAGATRSVTRLRMIDFCMKPVTNASRAAKTLIMSEAEQELRAPMIPYPV